MVELETTSAAAASAETGLEQTSSDGEWFLLDDIHMQIGQVSQLLDTMDLLGILPAEMSGVQCLYKLQAVVAQLHNFNNSFFVIVMPEGIKSFQKEDQSGESFIGPCSYQMSELIG